MSYQSRILSHPLFGSLNHTQARRPGSSQASKPIPSKDRRPKGGYSGFATSVETAKYSNTKQVVSEGANKTQRKPSKECLHCKEDHNLSSCPQLRRRNREEKLEFLRKEGVCFGCFEVGHMSKGCQKRLTCQVCSLKHPTILHINKTEIKNKKDERSKDTAVTDVYTNQTSVWSDTGAGNRMQTCYSPCENQNEKR